MPQSCPVFAPSSSPRREQFALIPFSVLQALSGTVTRSGILTYCALAAHADPSGHCWPGRARLAEITDLSERQISRATAELVKKGLLRKSYRRSGGIDYFLLPVATPAASQTPPPDTDVPTPLTTVSPRTAQGTNQKTKREPDPDPPPPEPETDLPPIGAHTDPATQPEAPKVKAKVVQLPTKAMLPDDWELPPDYRDWAEQRRPDLVGRLDAIADGFRDYHLSKGTRSANWLAEWRRWINRERAPRATAQRPQATQPERRYQTPAQEAALQEADKQAKEASEAQRIAMLIRNGIDPMTGLKLVPATPARKPAATPPPSPPSRDGMSYAERFARLQAIESARKLARESGQTPDSGSSI